MPAQAGIQSAIERHGFRISTTPPGMTTLFFYFHVSQASVYPSVFYPYGFWLNSPKVNGTAVIGAVKCGIQY